MSRRMASHIEIDGDEARVELTQGKWAVIDATDVHLVEGRPWYAEKKGHTWYAAWKPGRTPVQMHRVIAGTPAGLSTDHIDHDGLNNRRRNLRPCTHAENMANRRDGERRPAVDPEEVIERYTRWRLRMRRDADARAEIARCVCVVGSQEDLDKFPCSKCMRLPPVGSRTKAMVNEFADNLRAAQLEAWAQYERESEA